MEYQPGKTLSREVIMLARGFFLIGFLLFFNVCNLSAAILTIDTEQPELIKLRQNYEIKKKQAVSPVELRELKKKFETDKRDALQSSDFIKKRSAFEAIRDEEIKKTEAKYQASLEALKTKILTKLEKKQKLELAAQENNSLSKAHAKYIADMEKLEKMLIDKRDLAGALVVQTERKKTMAIDLSVAAETKAVEKPQKTATAKKPKPPAKADVVAPKPAKSSLSKDAPLTFVSNKKGIAGSAANTHDNVYQFKIGQVGNNSRLIFHAYGKRSNDTYGEVYLSMPNGKRKEITEWSPKSLTATNFYNVKSFKDVKPVEVDISKYVKKPGLYKVEFHYKDGNEPLLIFRVEVQTW